MPKEDYNKKPQPEKGLSYLEILQRAAERGDSTAKAEIEWRKTKHKNLHTPNKSYKIGLKRWK